MGRHGCASAAENEYVLCHISSKNREKRKKRNLLHFYGLRKNVAGSFLMKFATASPASLVPRLPPTSVVVCPCATAASTAASIAFASSRAPSVSSISAVDKMAPIGLAMFFPAKGGAEPCTGSNSDV